MQKVKLPPTVDISKSAQKRLDYDGIITVNQFERLNDVTEGVNGDVDVTLSFDVDAQGLKILVGKAKVDVNLECQRCWNVFLHHCEIEFIYSPIFDEDQDSNLPDAYEPAVVDENGEVNLIHLIEDEFMLALPQIAMHDDVDCHIDADNMVFGEIPLADERPNPFAVLKNIKQK